MKRFLATLLLSSVIAIPSYAALKSGTAAPDFSGKGALGGKDFSFALKDALKKGPVVVYFYPSAYTGGCDLEAHTFAENKEKFDAAGASIVGVSGDQVDRLLTFSADPAFCAGKFPVVSDSDGTISKSYDLKVSEHRPDQKDVRGVAIEHSLTERVTFVVSKDGKIASTMSSADDKLTPDQHVTKALEIVEGMKKN